MCGWVGGGGGAAGGDIFIRLPVCFCVHRFTSEKRSSLKAAPKGSEFFPFRIDPFQKGEQILSF